MTNETSSLVLPTQQALATPQSRLPTRSEVVSQQKATIAILSNWQELANPTHCLWFCPHQEIQEQKPTIAFPNVEQCLLLVGTKDNTDFFGHFSPLTAGLTGSAIEQVVQAIHEEIPPQTEESEGNKKVAIYTIAENDSPTDAPPSIEVSDFKRHFEGVGYEVKLHTLPHDLFGKTLLWNTEKETFDLSDSGYTQVLPITLGKYLSEKIYTEDG